MTTPAGSGVTNKGTTYSDGSQVTSTNLNDIVDDAVFNTNAVDDNTIGLNASSPKALFVKNAGIDTAQLKDNAVTFAKLADATLTSIKESLYPTGSLLTTTVNYADSAAVVAAYGGTTWVRFGEGQVLVGHSTTDSDFNAATPTTGGSKTHTLTTTEIPPHYHTYTEAYNANSYDNGSIAFTQLRTSNTGNGNIGENGDGTGNAAPHNNLQPYITVYMWKRTV